MRKRVIVMSLGGSLIVPKQVDKKFLKKFRMIIQNNVRKIKFIIVCGGGFTARKYMAIAKKQGKNKKEIGMEGMRATRENAEIVINSLKGISSEIMPKSKHEIKKLLKKYDAVVCGALRYSENETSDGTAAKLSKFFKTDFINMTNIAGLYSSNPKKNKKAKFIPKISWRKFYEKATKIKFFLGQHFILDQSTAKIIKKSKIKTYIIGKNTKNLDNLINNRKFKGTVIND